MPVTLNASTSAGLIQTADTSGTVEIQSNGTTRLTVASGGVTANNLTATGTFGGGVITSGTAQTASGSSVDFTGIPSWVKRITVTMTDISFAAAGSCRLRLGTSGGLVSSGYVGGSTSLTTVPAITTSSITDGLAQINTSAAASSFVGQFVIVNITGNTWQSNGFSIRAADGVTNFATTSIALSGTLDRLSLVAITSTFDAGTINILYEG